MQTASKIRHAPIPATTPAKHYVDNTAFESALEYYRANPSPQTLNRITERYFYPLAINVCATFGRGSIEQDDLVQEGVLACVRKEKYYHPERGIAFNFFTRVIRNAISTAYARESNRVLNCASDIDAVPADLAATQPAAIQKPKLKVKSPCQILIHTPAN